MIYVMGSCRSIMISLGGTGSIRLFGWMNNLLLWVIKYGFSLTLIDSHWLMIFHPGVNCEDNEIWYQYIHFKHINKYDIKSQRPGYYFGVLLQSHLGPRFIVELTISITNTSRSKFKVDIDNLYYSVYDFTQKDIQWCCCSSIYMYNDVVWTQTR